MDDSDEEEILSEEKPFKSDGIKSTSIENNNKPTETSSLVVEKLEPSVSKPKPFNLFPPRGIFANLNLDDLFDVPNKTSDNSNEHKTSQIHSNEIDKLNKLYGPSLPENKKISTSSISIKSIVNNFAEDEWVEKSESTNNESSHKNKHSKHKKSKHKHKSKKKSHKHR